MKSVKSRHVGRLSIALAYLLVMSAVVWGLGSMRRWSAATLDTEVARAQWQQFRDAVAEQSEQGGPVRRRVPRSVEPPALVLLRDHFRVCLALAIVLTSALFATFAFFLRGVFTQAGSEPAT